MFLYNIKTFNADASELPEIIIVKNLCRYIHFYKVKVLAAAKYVCKYPLNDLVSYTHTFKYKPCFKSNKSENIDVQLAKNIYS